MSIVRMTRAPCDSCPWKGRMELNPGRLKQLREETMAKDGVFVCHKLLDTRRGQWVAGPEATGAVCSGWRESAMRGTGGSDSTPWELQVAERLDMVEWVDV